jgi:hypothetical protein
MKNIILIHVSDVREFSDAINFQKRVSECVETENCPIRLLIIFEAGNPM